MNTKDLTLKEHLSKLGLRMGNIEQACEKILTNHLPTLEKKIDGQDKRIGLLLKIFSLGFVIIGVMLVILGIMVAV